LVTNSEYTSPEATAAAYQELSRRAARLSPGQIELFAYDRASRIEPIVDYCASPQTSVLYRHGLTEFRVGELSSSERNQLAEELLSVPEQWEGECSEDRAYWAYGCVQQLAIALSAVVVDDAAQEAVRACGLGFDMHSDLDFCRDETASRPGPWLRREIAAQYAALATVTGVGERAAAVRELQARATAPIGLLRKELPHIARTWV
jgi:hypothetical protein